MTEDKRGKMLERVRALLAKADSTTFPAEAQIFRDKADVLMTAWAIEQWQVDAAQEGVGARPTPVSRDFDMSWYDTNSRANELWELMQSTASHCRVTLVYWRYGASKVPAVGLQSDLDYFDMLFTQLMLEMAKGLEPKADADKSMIENLVALKEAGLKWERIGELLMDVGQLSSYDRNTGVRFTKEYTSYCRDNNRERIRTVPSVYQRSYARGFINEMRSRMKHQREKSEQTGSMELVLRDIREQVKDTAEYMFGADPKRYEVAKDGRVDQAAYHTGAADARNVSIAANPNSGVRQTRSEELTS